MLRFKSHPMVAVLAVAALILAAGSAVVASNMAFKFNKPLVLVPAGPANQTGNNWTSIPFNNPYGTIGGFCTQTGLKTGIGATQITTKNYNSPPFTNLAGVCSNAPATHCNVDTDCPASPNPPGFCVEGLKTYNCGTAGANGQSLIKGKSLQIRATTGTPTSIIIVGSHDPAASHTVLKNADFWLSVPYHTTYVNTNDMCASAALTSTGVTRAQITRLNPGPPASFQTTTCGSTTTFYSLVLGEGLNVREPIKNSVTFTPAHY